jgi:hypothetical protein
VYKDTAVLYDVAPGIALAITDKGPGNNIYVRIPHPLLDPVEDVAKQRLMKFYSETFWCNIEVFRCCQAAQALAKRSQNIDRCFIGVSPGGVGQSLYTAHLAALYGHNHAYFDPNVWYQDDELRKQVEQFAGCIIITGQEAPETAKRMREDLFKKTMSADGIAGRKPYGITTRMLEVNGWKRLEVNKIMRFCGVTNGNFNSILRRSLVWKPKARFLNRAYLQEHYPDSGKDGIFPADSELKQFLTSGPAILAGLRLQHGFEYRHGSDECRAIIEQYAALGGDMGLTEDVMRSACGLALRSRSGDERPEHGNLLPTESQDDVRAEGSHGLDVVMSEIIKRTIASGRDNVSWCYFRQWKMPDGAPNMDKASLWKSLIECGCLIAGHPRGCEKDPFLPTISVKTPLAKVIA